MIEFVRHVSILFRISVNYVKPIATTAKLCKTGSCKTLFSTTSENALIPHPHTVKKLQELFDFKKSIASNIILDNKRFAELSPSEIDRVFRTYIGAGITKEIIENNLEVLTASAVDEKIKHLSKLPYNLNTTFPFLLIDERVLKKFVEQEIREKRIKFFSALFEIGTNQVCFLLSKRSFLLTLDLQHIQKCCDLLMEYGITKKEICKDLWVLRYAIHNIEAKLKFAQNNNMKTIKTWMVRVPTHVFENCIRRKSDNQLILGEKSFMEYLSQRLQCSQELAKCIISKHPVIQKKSLRKINEMVDFLLCTGFKPVHICRTPKILLHSVDTIKTRLKLLDEQGKQLNSLSVCTKSKKQFSNFLESIKSDKLKENTIHIKN